MLQLGATAIGLASDNAQTINSRVETVVLFVLVCPFVHHPPGSTLKLKPQSTNGRLGRYLHSSISG